MSLRRLSYRSVRVPGLTDEALLRTLIAPAYQRNRAEGITGCLYCGEHSFVQVVEGEEAAVLDLMVRIASDARHRDLSILSSTTAGTRLFDAWGLKWVRARDGGVVERLSEAAVTLVPAKPLIPPLPAQPAASPLPNVVDVSLDVAASTLARRIIGELVVAEPTIF